MHTLSAEYTPMALTHPRWSCWRDHWQWCVCMSWWSLCDIPRSPAGEHWTLSRLFSPTELYWCLINLCWSPSLTSDQVKCFTVTVLFRLFSLLETENYWETFELSSSSTCQTVGTGSRYLEAGISPGLLPTPPRPWHSPWWGRPPHSPPPAPTSLRSCESSC